MTGELIRWCLACKRPRRPGQLLTVAFLDGTWRSGVVCRPVVDMTCLWAAGPRSASRIGTLDPEAARQEDRERDPMPLTDKRGRPTIPLGKKET